MRYDTKVKQSQQKREELLDEANGLDDKKLLQAVLDYSGITDEERKAFEDMNDRLGRRGATGLSPRQREWLAKVYVRAGFDEEDTGALNLVSNGKVPRGNVPTFPWEFNKPLKPPGQ